MRERRGDFAQKRAQTLLEVRLRLRVSVDMARTRHTQASAQPPQIDPAELTADLPRQALRHPGGDGAPVPAVVLRSWSIQRGSQFLVVRHRQELSMWPRETPLVIDALRPERIVAAHNLAYPVGGVPGEAGNGFSGEATCQELEEVPVTALDRIWRLTVPSGELIYG